METTIHDRGYKSVSLQACLRQTDDFQMIIRPARSEEGRGMYIKAVGANVWVIDHKYALDGVTGWRKTDTFVVITIDRLSMHDMLRVQSRRQGIADTHVRMAVSHFLQREPNNGKGKAKKWYGTYTIVDAEDLEDAKLIAGWR